MVHTLACPAIQFAAHKDPNILLPGVDTLARISLYLLSTPSPAFTSLIKPLLTPETIPNTLIVVLLDWSRPHLFLRQLREWILMLRDILQSLDARCVDAMQDVMVAWRDRGRGGGTVNLDGSGVASDSDAALPLGPSEWDDGLGLPLCVVCQNVWDAPLNFFFWAP